MSPVSDELQVFAAAVAPIGAIFTTIGVGVALFVAIRDSRRFAREEQLRHEQDTARRADQARLVQIVSYTKNQGDLRRISIELENLSDLPCQWPRSSPRRRPVVLPAGGHGFSPVAASCFSPPAF
ncbi:hypothetical protein [Rhodococcus sp. KB6]|uniref:hypothetical protein n=1 Tax=Rhodococcus sp. KB6 TaxID=1752066 RepID=UPI000A85FF30|nr:hypothetical protein [Rhodococcus sp. KB6]